MPFGTTQAHTTYEKIYIQIVYAKEKGYEMKRVVLAIRRQNPEIKIALLCDNVSDESNAYKVKCAKEDGSIDAFFYESVPSDYLADAIDAL